jgi:predicted RNase H-like HicB family nuclease
MGIPTELTKPLVLNVELEEEPETGRWIADVSELPGVMVYGATAFEALAKAKLLAIDVVGDRIANGEDPLTGCETRPPFEVAVGFGGIEFHHVSLAC